MAVYILNNGVSANFRRVDAGAAETLRHRKADCTVRALSTALVISYREAWQKLYDIQGRHRHCFFDLSGYLRKLPEEMGVEEFIKLPAKKGVPRMKVGAFARCHPYGRYLVKSAHHMTAVVDGTILDTWNCSRRTAYDAWRMR